MKAEPPFRAMFCRYYSQGAAALSGMAQCLGYALAAASPPLAGFAHDATQGWGLALGLYIAATLMMAAVGGLAGRTATL